MKPRLQKAIALLAKLTLAGVIAFLALEIGLAILCSRGLLDIKTPSYRLGNVTSRFWVDMNPDFGVWHESRSSFLHKTADYKVFYSANSYGARDKERTRAAQGRKRVVVLGDSFVEGYGTELQNRFTDLLEEKTGLEHLNFGTAGSFGPTQYYLLYKTMAKTFDHDAVIVCIFPFNDFQDDDFEYGKVAHESRYRPYFVDKKGNGQYELVYSMKQLPPPQGKLLENFVREFTYTGNLIKHMKGLARHRATATPESYAGYYDYTAEQWRRLCHVLGLLRGETDGKELIIVTIPSVMDLQRASGGEAVRLPADMAKICESLGITYVDLLPCMQSAPEGYRACYYRVDPHWNVRGNALAADYILDHAGWYKQASAGKR